MKRIYFSGIFPLFLVAFLALPHGTSAFTMSQNLISVPQGQTSYVSVSSGGGMSLSNASNAVATISLSGNQINITGVSGGQTLVTACVTGDGCQTLTITVPATVATTTSAPPTFSSGTTLSMQAGASQTVTVNGTGAFTLLSNSNPTVVGATVVGSTAYIMANTSGGDNLTICDATNQCSVLYVSVKGTSVSVNVPLTIVSYTITSSNSQGKFLNAGSNLQMSFNTDLPVTNATVIIGSAHLTAVGNGTGPFTVSYMMSGNESMPLPVSINVSDVNNNSGSFALSLGAGTPIVTPAPLLSTVRPTVSAGDTPSNIMLYKFAKTLHEGLTSTEVLALQTRLKAEGYFAGPLSGYFGPKTVAAVKAYQAKHGLTQLGFVGPGTRATLNAGN